MRLVFLGSPPFATPVLESLLKSRHDVAALVTQPDRPRGRGRKIATSPLVELAAERDLEVLQPKTTKDPEFVQSLASFEPDVLMVASYGEILREDVLELAPHGSLNVHASLLPRHRGASPIQRAILEGDEETGVTIQRMVLALDRGDVLLAEKAPIDAHENAGELLLRLAEIGGRLAVDALDRIEEGSAIFTPQNDDDATYAKKLSKEDGKIAWSRGTAQIDRLVRAMTPWPGARTLAPGEKGLVVLRARPVEGATDQVPGSVIEDDKRLLVATKDGVLELQEVKPAGKGAMDGASYLRGARLEAGAQLGA